MIRTDIKKDYHLKFPSEDPESGIYFKVNQDLINYIGDGSCEFDGEHWACLKISAIKETGTLFHNLDVIEVIPESDYYKYPMLADRILKLAEDIKEKKKLNSLNNRG